MGASIRRILRRMKVFTRVDEETTRTTFRLFKNELLRDRRSALQYLTMVPFSHLLRFVLTPLMISLIIQSLIQHPENYKLPLVYIAITAASMTISTFFNNKGYTALFKHEEIAQTRLLRMGMQDLMNRSYQFFTEQKVGTLAGDLMNFSRSYTLMVDNYFLNANHLIISFLFGLIVIAILSPLLLLPTIFISFLLIALNVKNIKARAPYRNKRKELTSKLAGSIADIMGNQLLVRIFATEAKESRNIGLERTEIEGVAFKEIDIIERESLVRQVYLYGFQIVTLLLFVWLSTRGSASIAGIIFTFTYINRSTDAIFGISSIIRQFEQAFLDAAPMTKILQMNHTVIDTPHAKKIHISRGEITFKDVVFSYSDQEKDPVFEKINIKIKPGEHIGLAGHSGGGKTTLTKLLLRFADIDKGAILIDQQNIAKVKQSSLRSQIAYVPQDPFLFHRTLRENIGYAKDSASDEEIIEAAKKAHAWEFIKNLPSGLDTIVGERGVKLSGGQRQRVAIARAMIKNAPILVLDEATSALDSESEMLIQKALKNLMKGRTAIVIAHRLSTIQKMDRIIVLDEGRIIEEGPHKELLRKNGIYAKLWKHQSGGFLEE